MGELPGIAVNEAGDGLGEGVVELGVDLIGLSLHDHALGLGFYYRLELGDTLGEGGVSSDERLELFITSLVQIAMFCILLVHMTTIIIRTPPCLLFS